MSVKAIDWVYRTKIGSPRLKFVLTALADYANSFGIVYPSTQTLARKVEMSPRTIVRALDQLEAIGLIEDTGKRVGKTKQIKVYRLSWADEEKDCQTVTLSEATKGCQIEPKDCQPEHENSPSTVIGSKNGGNRQEPSEVPPKSPKGDFEVRIAAIFHRRTSSMWSAKELKVFRTLIPFNDDDLCMIERRYAAEWPPREGNTLRRDLQTFLNNYPAEVDRAYSWCEKHPVRSKTLKAKAPVVVSEPPPADPEAEAKFLEDFKARHGRLPYGYTENGHEKIDS